MSTHDGILDDQDRENLVKWAANVVTEWHGSDSWIKSHIVHEPLILSDAQNCVLYRGFGCWSGCMSGLEWVATRGLDPDSEEYATALGDIQYAFAADELNEAWTDYITKHSVS